MNNEYVFGATRYDTELERLRAIEAIFDPASQRLLATAGITGGWRCLEIGAGAGSIARWMERNAGHGGEVTAVDIDCRFLSALSETNINIVEGDFTQINLPGAYDLVHARYVLVHITDPLAAITRMLQVLKPGGCIVLEEPDFSAARAATGPVADIQSFAQVTAAIHEMYQARGTDWCVGFKLPRYIQDQHCQIIHVEQDAPLSQGGSGIASMMQQSALQLRQKYLDTGRVTANDLDAYGRIAGDTSSWAVYYATIRVMARKGDE